MRSSRSAAGTASSLADEDENAVGGRLFLGLGRILLEQLRQPAGGGVVGAEAVQIDGVGMSQELRSCLGFTLLEKDESQPFFGHRRQVVLAGAINDNFDFDHPFEV